jgi:hypothetical protein
MSTLLERLEAIEKLELSMDIAQAARRDSILTLAKTNTLLAHGIESSILEQVKPLLDANRKLKTDRNACSGPAFEASRETAVELAELTSIQGSSFEFTNLGEVFDPRFARKEFWRRARNMSTMALPVLAAIIATIWKQGVTEDTQSFVMVMFIGLGMSFLVYELDILIGSKVCFSILMRTNVANKVEADAKKLDRYIREAVGQSIEAA